MKIGSFDADSTSSTPKDSHSAGKKWRILVVDDCGRTTRLIEAQLAGKNFEVFQASNVNDAAKLLLKEETRPDLILLDVVMPGISGDQFCRFIKGNELFSGIKVVLCSGIDKKQLEATAKKCGADGFVHKEAILGRRLLTELLRDSKK